jgi:hypothetical protein
MNSTKNGLLLSLNKATLESGPPAASQFTIALISPTTHTLVQEGRFIETDLAHYLLP